MIKNVYKALILNLIVSCACSAAEDDKQQKLEAIHPLLPVTSASASSDPVQLGELGEVTLHVHVDRSPVKAWCEAWTTSGRGDNDPRVNVGSLRVRLDWDLFEDSTLNNVSFHSQYEWSTNAAFKKARVTAWSENPHIGPVTTETKF